MKLFTLFNFWALLLVLAVNVAGDCKVYSGSLHAVDTASGADLGRLAIDLNLVGTLGITTSTNSSLFAQFELWNNCNDAFFYLKISNTKNVALPYASLVTSFTDCSEAAFPGYAVLTPASGGPIQQGAPPALMYSSFERTWNTPAVSCGETWSFGTWDLNPHWVDPNARTSSSSVSGIIETYHL
ncbi:hypothetical protein DL96DRAFT_1564659 [Flagelloscypha sp. PMI_526]|nr:hypothetical protein DL96DRAFT_1564659 [Flagelloscypha sp. PMI_526]